MIQGGKITRRTVLRGLGTAVGLPFLEAMLPRSIAMAGGAASQAPMPRRMGFVYVPNGVNMQEWTPRTEGADFALSSILEPLAPHRQDLMVLSGLTADKARPNGDGPGDHARAAAAFLTGAQPRKTGGADINVGVSVDQYAAARVGGVQQEPQSAGGRDSDTVPGNVPSAHRKQAVGAVAGGVDDRSRLKVHRSACQCYRAIGVGARRRDRGAA